MKNEFLLTLLFGVFLAGQAAAQDDDAFDFSDFEEAENTKIKAFCTNKVINLSPTKLVSLGYDFVGGFDLENTDMGSQSADRIGANHGLRLDANFPVISKSSVIVNMAVRYWESRYSLGQAASPASLGQALSQTPLRTSALGLTVFKPLNDRHFLVFMGEAALNGNYNFQDISPDFGKMKYSAAALFGWKTNDYTNFAIGATRTYRGGRVLHIPVMLYNKTFNETWGVEMLLPAYGSLRRNFSTKSILKLGYELEGQSYLLQAQNDMAGLFGGAASYELRKSEIRPRVSWDVAMTDFVWLSFQAGLRMNYRFALDPDEASTKAVSEYGIGLPYYVGFGINLSSP